MTRAVVDMPVLLKLQRKVKELEEEKRSLFGQLNRREEVEQEKSKVGLTTDRVHVIYCLRRFIGIRSMRRRRWFALFKAKPCWWTDVIGPGYF